LVLWLMGREDFAFSRAFFGLVLLRSLTDAGAEYAKMSALRQGDISLVSSFVALMPFFLLLFSPIITGDALTLRGIAAVLLTVVGSLLLIYEPTAVEEKRRTKAIKYAVTAALLFSLNSCFDRLTVQIASPVFSGFAMTILSALILSPCLLRRKAGVAAIRSEGRAVWLRGFFEVAFMVLKLSALQYLQAPYVTAIMSLSLLLSVVGGRYLFKEGHFVRRFGAAALMVCGTMLIALE